MSKINPIGLRAASLTLTGTLAPLLGTVSTDAANATTGAIRLGSLDLVRLQGTYTRHASSTTGRPSIAVDLSMDPDSTAPASVAHFFPVYVLDGDSFAAGAIDGLAQAFRPAPSVTGASSFGTPPVDVRGAHWMRVRLADVDGTNCGAVSLLVMGGVA